MDKKLLVFSIFVSLFILGGLSFVLANTKEGGLHAYGLTSETITTGRDAANSSRGIVLGGTTTLLNFHITKLNATHPFHNITVFYNTTMTVFAKATLASVSGNTTCVSNVCNATAVGGASFVVDWTFPTTNTLYKLIAQYKFKNGTARNVSASSLSLVRVDTTKPTVTLTGRGNATFAALTDAFVFVNLNRFNKHGVGINYTMIAKVSDINVRNCTLWTEFGFNQKNTFAANKTGVNTVGGRYGFLNNTGTVGFWNATHHYRGAVPNDKFKWGVACYDNATTPNYGVASTNFTFYFDNKSPVMAATNPLTFEDSDPNSKDTSTSGLFRIGGVWTSELLETLTFTCDVSEANLVNVKFLIKRPGATVFDLEKLSTSKTLKFTETSKTGIYEIKCITTDIAGNATTSTTAKFRLQSEDEGEVPGTAAYVKPFNVDFSKTDSKNIVEPAGRILTVTFDGKTEHTVNFQKVTATSVTLVITSTPKTLNLNVGDTKNVDVNDDGVDDFAVSLIGIIEGKANVNFKKLSGAAAVAREEAGGTATTVSGGTAPTTSGRSTTGIWIVVLIVVVGVIIYLVVARKKKK